jgi:glutathione peroxidase
MERRTFLWAFPAAALFASPLSAQQPRSGAANATMSFYDLDTRTLDGKPADLSRYRGSVSLVVNVASYCGYTPQYKGLERLHREPGTAQEIAEFCRLTYDVTFPMFEKVVTKRGTGQSPVYAFLGRSGNLPAWNFSKYVIDRQGRVVAFFPSDVTPEDSRLRAAIAKALAAR